MSAFEIVGMEVFVARRIELLTHHCKHCPAIRLGRKGSIPIPRTDLQQLVHEIFHGLGLLVAWRSTAFHTVSVAGHDIRCLLCRLSRADVEHAMLATAAAAW